MFFFLEAFNIKVSQKLLFGARVSRHRFSFFIFLFLAYFSVLGLNASVYRISDAWCAHTIPDISGPVDLNDTEKKLYDAAVFVVDELYYYSECEDKEKIESNDFTKGLTKAFSNVKARLATLCRTGDDIRELRKIKIDYNGKKVQETRNPDDEIIENPMHDTIDIMVLGCMNNVRDRIQKHLEPIAEKFKDEYFIEDEDGAGCEFEELLKIRKDLEEKEEDLEKVVAYLFTRHGCKHLEEKAKYREVFEFLDSSKNFRAHYTHLLMWEAIAAACDVLTSEPMQYVMTELSKRDSGKWSATFGHCKELLKLQNEGVINCFLQGYELANSIVSKKGGFSSL